MNSKWSWDPDDTVKDVTNFYRDSVLSAWRRGYTQADARSLCAYLNSRSLL